MDSTPSILRQTRFSTRLVLEVRCVYDQLSDITLSIMSSVDRRFKTTTVLSPLSTGISYRKTESGSDSFAIERAFKLLLLLITSVAALGVMVRVALTHLSSPRRSTVHTQTDATIPRPALHKDAERDEFLVDLFSDNTKVWTRNTKFSQAKIVTPSKPLKPTQHIKIER